jgi:hypothetical protein
MLKHAYKLISEDTKQLHFLPIQCLHMYKQKHTGQDILPFMLPDSSHNAIFENIML